MYHTRSVTQAQVHDHGLLAKHLKIKDYSKKCTATLLISLLLLAYAAAAATSA